MFLKLKFIFHIKCLFLISVFFIFYLEFLFLKTIEKNEDEKFFLLILLNKPNLFIFCVTAGDKFMFLTHYEKLRSYFFET